MLERIITEINLQSLLPWLAGLSLVTFFLSLLLIPFLVGKLAPNCFLELCRRETKKLKLKLSIVSLSFLVLRNLFGLFLLIAGFAMLFLPGQGILTMLLGIFLLSFPGKKRLVIHLISFPAIRRSLNWLRQQRGKQPFIWPNM